MDHTAAATMGTRLRRRIMAGAVTGTVMDCLLSCLSYCSYSGSAGSRDMDMADKIHAAKQKKTRHSAEFFPFHLKSSQLLVTYARFVSRYPSPASGNAFLLVHGLFSTY